MYVSIVSDFCASAGGVQGEPLVWSVVDALLDRELYSNLLVSILTDAGTIFCITVQISACIVHVSQFIILTYFALPPRYTPLFITFRAVDLRPPARLVRVNENVLDIFSVGVGYGAIRS